MQGLRGRHAGRARLLAEERFAASQVLLALLLRQRDVGPPEPAVLAALGTLLARLATEGLPPPSSTLVHAESSTGAVSRPDGL